MTSENIKLNPARLDDPEFSKYGKMAMEEAESFGSYTAKAWIQGGFDKEKVVIKMPLPLLLEDKVCPGVFWYAGVRLRPLDRRHGFLKNFTPEEIRAALAEIGVSCE